MIRETDRTIAKMIRIADKKQTGMTLISASTGKGKTYEIVKYAVESINAKRYDRVVFIEPRHSIFSDITKNLYDRGVNPEQILYLRSSKDNALEHYEEVCEKSIKDKKLKDMIGDLLDCCKSYKSLETAGMEHVFDDLIVKNKSEVKRYCIKNKDKISKEDLDIVKKLFPEEIKPEHNFIFMTMDKMFHSLDILKKENRFLSGSFFSEKVLVVIDELDKCYAIALSKLADNKDTLEDLLAVIQNAYVFISDTDNRWQVIIDEEYNTIVEDQKIELREEIDDLNSEFGILNNFMFEQNDDSALELFVSRAQTFIASAQKNFQLTKGKQRTIIKQWPERTEFSVIHMVIRCKEVVRKILNFVYLLGEAYRNQNSEASYEEGIYYGISQVFNKTLAESDYYLNYAMDNSIKTQSLRIDKGEFTSERSVCNNGFSHCLFNNKPGTNHSYMTSSGIDLTPENVFAWLAKKSNVIGLSATQQIPTVVSLDIDYEQRILEDSFDCYSREDFEKANERVVIGDNIVCDIVRSFSADRKRLLSGIQALCKEKGIIQKDGFDELVFEAIDTIDGHNGDNYNRNREYKRFYALCRFAFESKAISGIVILNSKYNIEPYKKFIRRVSEFYGIHFLDEDNICPIQAENIGTKLDEIKDKLNRGEKCLIVSNKEAVGQGVNIQYERDFNFFYQEEPTNVFPVVKNREVLSEQDKNKLVYLVMKMASNQEISEPEMRSWISKALKGENHKSKEYSSIRNAKTSIFIQGLGRANRTANKEEKIFVYFDEELCDALELENLMVEKTPELLAVEKRVKEYGEQIRKERRAAMNETERLLCFYSNRLQKKIENLLTIFSGKNMTNERIEAQRHYKKILDIIYKYGPWPRLIDENDKEIIDEIGYVKVDCPLDIWTLSKAENYCEDIDYLSTSYKEKMQKMKWESVLKIKNYPKPDGECWMINPKAFNLLQGTVGEKQFASLFKENIKVYQLEEPNLDEYEVCGDFKVKGTNIYVDVKNFNEQRGTIDLTLFAETKLEMIRERNPKGKLVIVNVYAKDNYKTPKIDDNDFLVVSNVLNEYGVRHKGNIRTIVDWIDDANK